MTDEDFYRFCYFIIDSGDSLEEVFDLKPGETIDLPPREELSPSKASDRPDDDFIKELLVDTLALVGRINDIESVQNAKERALEKVRKQVREIAAMNTEDVTQEHLEKLKEAGQIADQLTERLRMIRESEIGTSVRRARSKGGRASARAIGIEEAIRVVCNEYLELGHDLPRAK